MAASLLYPTGRTVTLNASGQVTLHYCGATSVSGGWRGPGGNTVPDGDPTRFPSWSVALSIGFGPTVLIETGLASGPNPLHSGDPSNQHWFTSVTFGANVQLWTVDADPTFANTPPTPPDVFARLSASLVCEEWAAEFYTTVRPSWAGNASIVYFLRPSGMYHAALTHSAGSWTLDDNALIATNADLGIHLREWPRIATDPSVTLNAFQLAVEGIVTAPEVGDLPFPAVFATASDLEYGGPQRFQANFPDPYVSGFPAGTEQLSTTGFALRIPGPTSSVIYDVSSLPDYAIPITGDVRDWNGPLYSIPFGLYGALAPVADALFTGSATSDPYTEPGGLDAAIPVGFLSASPYTIDDSRSPLIREPGPWAPLSINRATSLEVLDFTITPSGLPWVPTNCTATVSGAALVCAATGSGPQIARDLQNDLNDMEAYGTGPDAWLTAHAGAIPAAVTAWHIGTGGPTPTADAPGKWYRVRKKLLAGSDVFNWASFRYGYLKASADTACTITLAITWDDLTIADDGGTFARNGRTVEIPVSVGTSLAEVEIDLPAWPDAGGDLVGHDGLQCVRHVEVRFPAGRTLTLATLTFREKSRPKVDVHAPGSKDGSGDAGGLTAIGDGKHCLFSNGNGFDRPGDYPYSIWGLLARQRETGDGLLASSLTCRQLAAEIALQEGWTATASDHSPVNFASDLSEVFEQPCPATLHAQRSFGAYSFYPQSGKSVEITADLGTAVYALVFDPDTHQPASTAVRVEDSAGNILDTGTSDAAGAIRLEAFGGRRVILRTSPGTAHETVYPPPIGMTPQYATLASRTLWYATLPGKSVAVTTGVGPVVLDIDRLGNRWITYVRDNAVKVGRQMGAFATWEEYDVGAIGADPWIHVDESHRELRINVVFGWNATTIYQASSRENGLGSWKLLDIASGTHPFIRKDKASGITHYLYWRADSGGTVFLKRSPDDGNTFLESEIAVRTGMAEATTTFDWALDDPHTMILVYDNAGTITQLVSTDNGHTWS